MLASEVSRTISDADPPEAKLRKLYTRVQQIRNLSMEDSKSEKEERAEKLKLNMNVEDVLKRGYGGSRRINYTYIGLLRAAGFEAAALYVAPRTGDAFRPEMRDTAQLNADLVWIHTTSWIPAPGITRLALFPGSSLLRTAFASRKTEP